MRFVGPPVYLNSVITLSWVYGKVGLSNQCQRVPCIVNSPSGKAIENCGYLVTIVGRRYSLHCYLETV